MINPKDGNYRNFPVSTQIHEAVSKYRGGGTMNSALAEIERRAELAVSQGAQPVIDYANKGAALHLDKALVARVKLTAEQWAGKEMRYEDAFRVVVALASEAKE